MDKQKDRQTETDDGQQVIWKAYVNFQFRCAKNLLKTSQNKFQTKALIVLWRQKKNKKIFVPSKKAWIPELLITTRIAPIWEHDDLAEYQESSSPVQL